MNPSLDLLWPVHFYILDSELRLNMLVMSIFSSLFSLVFPS